MDFKTHFSSLILVLGLAACSENILSDFADQETYEALVFAAKKELNQRNYVTAATLYEQAGGATGANLLRQHQADYASAFSGQCGLEFVTLVEALADTSADALLNILMAAFPGSDTTAYTACITAETRLDNNIGDFNVLDGNENLLMAFNSFAKMGAILAATADDVDNDGAADGDFDHCDSADISDLEVSHIGSGIARIVTSLGAVGGSYADIDDLTAFCLLAPPGICDQTDATVIAADASLVNALRHLIGSTDYGVGSCGNTFANCFNPVTCP